MLENKKLFEIGERGVRLVQRVITPAIETFVPEVQEFDAGVAINPKTGEVRIEIKTERGAVGIVVRPEMLEFEEFKTIPDELADGLSHLVYVIKEELA